MAKTVTPPSVYLIVMHEDIIKVGESNARRWRTLTQRNDGNVIGVWHFPSTDQALSAERQGLAHLWQHGKAIDAGRLRDRAGHLECVTSEELSSLIDSTYTLLNGQPGALLCPDFHWCGTSQSPCLQASAKHEAKHQPSTSQAMHVRTDGRTNEESGSVVIKVTTESRTRNEKK